MKFTAEEKSEIKQQFAITTSVDDIRKYLPENIFSFLHESGDIPTILDRLNIFHSNLYKPYDSLLLIKFMNANSDIAQSLSDLCYTLNGNYLLFVDFHTLFLVGSETDRSFKLQRGSKFSHINSIIEIVSDSDIENLLKEFEDLTHRDLLNKVFTNHKALYDFNDESAYQPVAILSMVVNIQLFPGP